MIFLLVRLAELFESVYEYNGYTLLCLYKKIFFYLHFSSIDVVNNKIAEYTLTAVTGDHHGDHIIKIPPSTAGEYSNTS